MDSQTPATADDDIDMLARTLWGEARGEGEAGMQAVAAVVLNRVATAQAHQGNYWWGATIKRVCRAQAQFSCWNPGDPNRPKLLTVDDRDPEFRRALIIAADAAAGRLGDPTLGATSYKVASLPWPHSWGRPRLPLVRIGKHEFFNLLEE
jgi:spore germination cell wall hydrolase CwlJ-like protein